MARFSTRTLVSVITTTATVPQHCILGVATPTCTNRRRRRDLVPITAETDDRWVFFDCSLASCDVLWLVLRPVGRRWTKLVPPPGRGGRGFSITWNHTLNSGARGLTMRRPKMLIVAPITFAWPLTKPCLFPSFQVPSRRIARALRARGARCGRPRSPCGLHPLEDSDLHLHLHLYQHRHRHHRVRVLRMLRR